MRRNLIKRRIREGVRKNKDLLTGWDIVVHPRINAGIGSSPEVTSELGGLLESVGQRKELEFGKAKYSDNPSSL